MVINNLDKTVSIDCLVHKYYVVAVKFDAMNDSVKHKSLEIRNK